LAKISAYISLFTDYRPNMGLGKILILVAGMSIRIYQYRYWQKYWPGKYIGIGWTHIGLSLPNWDDMEKIWHLTF
jgi:hypothetical protein